MYKKWYVIPYGGILYKMYTYFKYTKEHLYLLKVNWVYSNEYFSILIIESESKNTLILGLKRINNDIIMQLKCHSLFVVLKKSIKTVYSFETYWGALFMWILLHIQFFQVYINPLF